MKKNIMLTVWLALPILVVAGLMVWIFVSLDKDKLMADAPAVGAGAGDTGNANAIGEMLAGNDADAISLANRAKREGVAVDPREWPGGMTLRLPADAFAGDRGAWNLWVLDENGFEKFALKTSRDAPGFVEAYFPVGRLSDATIYAMDKDPILVDNELVDPDGRVFKSIKVDRQVPGAQLQARASMVVELEMESVYEASP
ncbi:MAG: hypothetical protein JKY96_07855 [Phycisphaerales bacterium]|nr:hypothetical protein [Phycisphaerales bacterium]